MKHLPFLFSALFLIPMTANAETVHVGAGSTKVTHLSKTGRVLGSYVTQKRVQVRLVARKKIKPQPVIASVTINEPKAAKVVAQQETTPKPTPVMKAKPALMAAKPQAVIAEPKQTTPTPQPQQAIAPVTPTKPVVEAAAQKQGWGPSHEEHMEETNHREGQPMGGDYRVRMNDRGDRFSRGR